MRKPPRERFPLSRWGARNPAPGVVSRRHVARSAAGTTSPFAVRKGMARSRPPVAYDRALERRRAVALARHFRESEGLSIAQIAERLGRSPATVKAYFYDPS